MITLCGLLNWMSFELQCVTNERCDRVQHGPDQKQKQVLRQAETNIKSSKDDSPNHVVNLVKREPACPWSDITLSFEETLERIAGERTKRGECPEEQWIDLAIIERDSLSHYADFVVEYDLEGGRQHACEGATDQASYCLMITKKALTVKCDISIQGIGPAFQHRDFCGDDRCSIAQSCRKKEPDDKKDIPQHMPVTFFSYSMRCRCAVAL